MLRYQLLLQRALDEDNPDHLTLRELARKVGIPIPTMHTYVADGVLPRIDNATKIAHYFGEDISSLFSEDDDLTARLVRIVRRLPATQKKALLEELR